MTNGFGDNGTKLILSENISLTESNLTENILPDIDNKNMENYEKSELDKLFEVMRKNEETSWRQGDVLIASTTILAFFGFASFLTAQFRGKNPQDRTDFLKNINKVLFSIFIIQILQLVTISLIIMNVFHWSYYLIIIFGTGLSLFGIWKNTKKIISLQNSGDVKRIEGTDMVKQAEEKYKMLRKIRKANKELEKLKKTKSE